MELRIPERICASPERERGHSFSEQMQALLSGELDDYLGGYDEVVRRHRSRQGFRR